MNIKKLVSAVSALTIAGSAFAGLAVTANAMDTISIDYEAEGAAVDWASGDTTRYTAAIATDSTSGNKYMNIASVSNGNNGTTVSTNSNYTGKVDAGTDFTMTFKMAITGGNDKSNTEFKIESEDGYILDLKQKAAGQTADYIINGNTSRTVNLTKAAWYNYTVTRSGSKTYLTITDAKGNALLSKKLLQSGSTKGGITKLSFATGRYYAGLMIDDIIIKDVADGDLPSTSQGFFTVKYVTDNGTVLKRTGSDSGDVDSSPELTSNDKASFVEDEQKYIYVSDNSADVTISSESTVEVTVTVRAAKTYTAMLYSSMDTSTPIGSSSVFEGDNVNIPYDQYVLKDGTLYESDKLGDSSKAYYYTFSNVSANTDYTVTYKPTKITNVVYHSEAEDISGLTASNSGNIGSRLSGCYGAYATADTTLTTLQPGTYEIHAVYFAGNKSGATMKFTLGSHEFEFTENKASNWITGSEKYTLTEASDLVFKTSGANNAVLDYIYVVKEPETHDEAFKFTKTANELSGSSINIVFENDLTKKTQTYDAGKVGTDFTGDGGVSLAVVVKGIADGYSVKSITIE